MKKSKLFFVLLRMVLGWLFLYQGISTILHQGWSILPYIEHAKTFPHFYAMVSVEPLARYVSLLVQGLFIVVGILLILGVGTRLAAFLGILVELFFYFPLLQFPHVGNTYYIVDEHILSSLILVYFLFSHKKEHHSLFHMFKRSRY